MRRFRYAVIVLVLGTAAACTSDAKTEPSDPSSTPAPTSASATQSATPPIVRSPSPSVATTGPNVRPGETVPVLPALAKTNSRPGAAAFAYYWFRALDWGYATTDSTLAKTLYLPQCTACADFMKNYDETKAAGQHFKGGRTTLESRRIYSGTSRYPGATGVDVIFSVAALQTLAPNNRVIGTDPAQKSLRYRLWLQWTGGHWAVRDYDREATK